MFMHSHLLAVASVLAVVSNAALAENPNLGRIAAPEEVASWDISIGPDGAGLPPGSGTPKQGEAVYTAKCLVCHGEKGAGKPNDALVGGRGTLVGDQPPVKTVGSFWPYATTLFDYVRRAMPLNESKSLTNEEVYAVVAYLLQLGEKGAGKPNDALVGGRGTLVGDQPPVKTVGSFWPYATTLFDYVRRAMPLNESKSLTNDEVYAVVAYLLQLNGIIGENETINAQVLPRVQMPNRDGFMTFSRGK